jgi:hypothetical protein
MLLFGMTFSRLPKEMNITFSKFIYFPTYFDLVAIINRVVCVRKQSLCSFIVTIWFMFHSAGPTFINSNLTFITSCLIYFSYFRSPVWFLFCIVSYDVISSKYVIAVFIFSTSDRWSDVHNIYIVSAKTLHNKMQSQNDSGTST